MKFAYANFDDERLEELKADQLNDVLEVLYKIYGDFSFLFLDEIQNVEGWHLFVNRLLRKESMLLLQVPMLGCSAVSLLHIFQAEKRR